MRKIIDGKAYDTEKARLVGSWANNYNRGDFHYCEEDLYQTAKGRYFIHGAGGPLSSYAESVGSNGSRGSEDIRPLDEAEAREWAEAKLSAATFEDEFGEVEEA